MSQPAEIKETKAQRSERLKREKNPWEAFNEVREFARQGRSSVTPEWAGFYFKWWGVYTQGDGVGAVGGKGGEGATGAITTAPDAVPILTVASPFAAFAGIWKFTCVPVTAKISPCRTCPELSATVTV